VRNKPSLRRRIIGAYILLAIVLCGFVGVFAVHTFLSIEDRLINHRLRRMADAWIAQHHRPGAFFVAGMPKVLQGPELHPAFRELDPGIHEMNLDGRSLHVLIRDMGGERYAIVDDETKFERLERRAALALAGAIGTCLAAALILGFSTASRVIAPLTQLAKAVETGDLGADSPLIAAEDELGVLARTFARHSAQLNLFLERERVFTGDVSHELRTPLTVILGAAEVLHARLHHLPELQASAERIRRTAADAAERVNALLLLSRAPDLIGAADIDLVALVRTEIGRCAPLLAHKPVKLCFTTFAPQVLVHARSELAAMALGNLIRNACAFTEAGEVRVQIAEGEVTVEDTGPGIPEDIRGCVFERHAGSAHSKGSGAGLGLAIVRRLTEHLAWQIVVQHPAAGGARFVLNLPMKAIADGDEEKA
jgi:signal transduction histidine kinase